MEKLLHVFELNLVDLTLVHRVWRNMNIGEISVKFVDTFKEFSLTEAFISWKNALMNMTLATSLTQLVHMHRLQ